MTDKSVGFENPEILRITTFEQNITALAKGGGITFAGKLFLSASRLVTAVLLARLLGAEEFGLYNLAMIAANIAFGLALFGLDSAMVRYIAILANRRDDSGLWGTIQVGIGVATFFSVLTGTALYALAFPIAQHTFHEPRLAPLLQLVSAIVPLLTFSEILASANQGFQRMEYPAIAQFIAHPIIRLVLIVLLTFTGMNAAKAIIIYGLAEFCSTLILLYFLNRLFSLKRFPGAARRDFKPILSFSLPVWLSQLMLKFRNNVQTVLIGSLNTISGVGIFTVASQLTTVGGLFSTSINISAKPIVAELHDQGDLRQMGRIYQMANKWSLMVQLPLFLALQLYPATFLSIFGESFMGGATALAILAWANLVDQGTGMCGTIIDMTGQAKLKFFNSLIRLALYLILDILLIPRWGLMGAAIAALAGEGVINLLRLIEVFILYRLLPYNKSFLKPILAAVIALGSAYLANRWLPADANPFHIIVQLLILFTVYAGINLLLGFSPDERMILIKLLHRARTIVLWNKTLLEGHH